MYTDYVLNGVGHGRVGSVLGEVRYDSGLMRPYKEQTNGRTHSCCTINTGRKVWNQQKQRMDPVFEQVRIKDLMEAGIHSQVMNATTLRKEEWAELDRKVLLAARLRMRMWADVVKRASYGGFNGMAKMILEQETASDPGIALVDMEGLTPGHQDSQQYQLQGTPLPITHTDFWFGDRRLAISRNSGMGLDIAGAEAGGRRIAEMIEKTTIGVETGVLYGGNSTQTGGYGRPSQVYGALNFPNRLTNTQLTLPTQGGWTPATTINQILGLRDQLTAQKFYGPFMIYHSNDWDRYMDQDYILTGGNVATQTMRKRILEIGADEEPERQILGCKRLDFLSATVSAPNDPARILTANPFTLIIVQLTPEVVQAINGQDITTIQWPTVGGMKINFKIFCIQVPRYQADHYGNCGLLVAT